MGYLHINNLYKDQRILLFKEVYALEKIDGTSAHVGWRGGNLSLYGGCVGPPAYRACFALDALEAALKALGHDDVIVYGEAYGGKVQGMSKVYGPTTKFVAFDVRIGHSWLDVPDAQDVVGKLGLEFVAYNRTPTDLAALNIERDRCSIQAIRNDMGDAQPREGVVLRPIHEVMWKTGERVITKHKQDRVRETKAPRVVGEDLEVLTKAEAIATEWVTDERLRHVLDHLGNPNDLSATPAVLRAMVEDVLREGADEIVDSKVVRRAISKRAQQMFHIKVKTVGSG